LGQYGVSYREAIYEMPVEVANGIIALHWLAQGIELTSNGKSERDKADLESAFEKITNRKKSWQLEQL
jgi:hypothetical protein